MKIYAFPMSPRSFKVLVVANHLGLDYELVHVDLMKGEQMQPQIVALNPNHRMPILEEDGYVLWESNAILQYLAAKKPEGGLLPMHDIKGGLNVTRWLFWDSAHWDSSCAVLVYENFLKGFIGAGEPDPAEVARGEKNFARSADVLESQLEKHRFIAGDHLTIADFAIGSSLLMAEAAHYPLHSHKAIRRWHAELTALPAWQRTAEAREAEAA